MNPFDSTLAWLLEIATAITLPIKSAVAHTMHKPILPVLRRLLVPPFYPDPEPAAAWPVFSANCSNNKSVELRKLLAGFCFAVGVGFLSVDSCSSHFPTPFMVISVLSALTFSFVLVSDFVRIKYPAAARVLEFIGLLSASAALFTALSIPLTDDLKPALWSVYAGTVVLILVINLISTSDQIHLIKYHKPDPGERKDDLYLIVEIQANMIRLENSASSP